MIVPTKKLNVHLINRVGGSDCAPAEKGERKEVKRSVRLQPCAPL